MTELAKKRPEFRNINALVDLPTYRLPAAGFVSILHRISGLVMFLLLPFVVWMFDTSVSSEISFAKFKAAILVTFIPGETGAHVLPLGVGRQSGGANSKPVKSKAGLTVQPTRVQRPRETALCHQPFGTMAKGR